MNRWSQVKNRKAANDAVKGKVSTQMSRLITNAVKEANGNVDSPTVLAVVDRAKRADVSRETIERALKKGSDKNEAAMEAITYEGYGPAGVGIMVTTLTDNRNRTGQEIRYIFSQGGSLGTPGSVSWGFARTMDGEWNPMQGTEVDVPDDKVEELSTMIDSLENHDDVTGVYTNAKDNDNS